MTTILKDIIVDTSYLLPLFGIRVEGIDENILFELSSQGISLFYPKLLIVELIAKIGREAAKRGLSKLPEETIEALNALLLEVDVNLIEPSIKHLETAIKLRILGHKDMFDNILYATAFHEKKYLLMEDPTYLKFLRKNNFPVNFIVNQLTVKKILN